ncbi:MAG: hypothetical protein V4632_03115 [Pseudomonadota bacterium]
MTLNEYIIQNAGRGNDDEFLRRFGLTEVFFAIDTPSENLKDGPLAESPDVALQMQTARLEIGNMALFYTTRNDVRLSQRFGGLPLIKAAEMICDLPGVEGMLIQSDGDAWFAADKQTLKHVLGQVRTPNFGQA